VKSEEGKRAPLQGKKKEGEKIMLIIGKSTGGKGGAVRFFKLDKALSSTGKQKAKRRNLENY